MTSIVVTGAASGIGLAVATQLLTQGHDIVAVDRAELAWAPGRTTVACDLADPAAVEAFAASLGPVGGLANVAGVPGTGDPAIVLRVNFLGARRLARALQVEAGGCIVNVASLAARRPGVDDETAERLTTSSDDEVLEYAANAGLNGSAAYDLSKKLLVADTVLLSAEGHARGLRACSVSPGPVVTPIIEDFRTSMGASVDAAADLVGRHASAAEVGSVVCFLLSSQASWVSGVDLPVDGGLMALRAAASRGVIA